MAAGCRKSLPAVVAAVLVAGVIGGLAPAGEAVPSGPRLGAFWLVDAGADVLWARLPFEELVDLDHAPAELNLSVVVAEPVGSVTFSLDGVAVKTENLAPYAMGGDLDGDYLPLDLPTGFHIIEAVAYSGPDGTGEAGPTAIVTVEIGRSDFDVTTEADAPDSAPGNASCGSVRAGGCTLRAAVEEANALPGRQWIHVPDGHYELSLGELPVTDRVTIIGRSPSGTVVDAAGSRGFSIRSARSDLDSLTITGAMGEGGGGAVLVNPGAEVRLLDAIITGNDANGGPGAGLRNDGTATVLRSTFSDNDAGFDGICGGGVTARGGAIGNNGTLRVTQSAFTANLAARGGALSNVGTAAISNSTFSGNRVRGGGGAIINQVSSTTGPATLHVAFSTITANEANVPCRVGDGDPVERRVGGGIYNTAVATIGSSIIAQNIDNRSSFDAHYAPDCWSGVLETVKGEARSAGRNVWGELNDNCNLRYPNGLPFDACNPAQDGPGGCVIQPGEQVLLDKWGTPDAPLDAGLGTIGGGPPAHPLDADSPAVDFGGSLPLAFVFLACPETDQQQRLRPLEGEGVCDAGALERLA